MVFLPISASRLSLAILIGDVGEEEEGAQLRTRCVCHLQSERALCTAVGKEREGERAAAAAE